MSLKSDIVAYAHSLGFERVGIASARSLPDQALFLEAWLSEGRAGTMAYLEREPRKRAEPAAHLPEAQSVIALAVVYNPGHTPKELTEGRVARYATGRDYHKVIGKKLEALVRYLETAVPDSRHRTFVDTGPLLERSFAQQAGLGFVGKNTMLITRGLGSWVFLAHVVTSIALPADEPDLRGCGECRLCIDACPTEAITAPYELDARRCISYLTIEQRGPVEQGLRERVGGWVFGCDICQDVCPHNTRAPVTVEPSFAGSGLGMSLMDLLSVRDDSAFEKRFAGTPFMRAKRSGLLRNACLAAANLGRRDLLPVLERLATDDAHPLIREHAAWAVEHLKA
jgi:epoxyqueuosine reductase